MATKIRSAVLPVITETQAGYLAGIVDGEGYITIGTCRGSKGAKGMRYGICYRLLVGVNMTDKKVIDWIRLVTGKGTMQYRVNGKQQNHKPSYRWQLWANQAAAFLRIVQPHIIGKTKQIELALRFQDAKRDGVGKRGLSAEEWQSQVDAHAMMQQFNKRGL